MELLDALSNFSENKQSEEHAAVCEKSLICFIKNNENSFTFTDYPCEVYDKVICHLFTFISSRHRFMPISLEVLRLLSRDKTIVTTLNNVESYLEICIESLNSPELIESGKVEVLKCLCNWVYHSNIVRSFFVAHQLSQRVIEDTSKCSFLCPLTFYYVRILFLMSALEPNERVTMLEHNIINVLCAIGNQVFDGDKSSLDIACQNVLAEIFKALFNVTCKLTRSATEKIINACSDLVTLLCNLFTKFPPALYDDTVDLLSHSVHLLVNMPQQSLCHLYYSATKKTAPEKVFCKYNMEVIFVLLNTLDSRIQLKNYKTMCDKSLPIFTAFCYICRINPIIRKYLKKLVLPPLKVSDIRPEQNKDLRGRIVALMTTFNVPLKNMAADFLFVLCKENNVRLIRYAGYGNSAGYLASRGLLAPGFGKVEGEYSEDELSDFDDEDEVDIMTGATRPDLSDDQDFSKLSDSEKEAEANKLVNMIEKLQSMNVVVPMSINKDGKMAELNMGNLRCNLV
ncbi:synembryn-A isoform X2 [Hydra vulgaris]|uniref:synembryn-A isoform X2 n=1 Tax=Hydra vulgaris TaxID=6087 RepID=UPI001F5F1505|nr:synembryn-A isoform X1 [Hydra vulgaris]